MRAQPALMVLIRVASVWAGAMWVHSAHAAVGDEVAWRPLFNGRNLDGWEQRGGAAKYVVKGGAIHGASVPNTPNSFLCTKQRYSDFILEYEFKVDSDLNAGVQIRSNSVPTYQEGRVHGYQVEIDPDPKKNRFWTGGLYDEGRRGWLADLSNNDAARKAFKQDQWNHIRVEAVGDEIQTWVNGVAAAQLRDAMNLSGFIALQVHDVGSRTDPAHIAWRNLRIKDLGKHVWVDLFDGKTLNGLFSLKGQWTISDGVLKGRPAAAGWGALQAEGFWDDVVVKVVYRLKQANGGLYVRARPNPELGSGIDGLQADLDADASRVGGLFENPGRGWLVRPRTEAMTKALVADGGWNEVVLSAHGGQIVSRVNGILAAQTPDENCRTEGVVALEVFGGAEAEIEVKQLAVLAGPIPPPAPGVQIGLCSSLKGDALEKVRDAGFDFAEIQVTEVAAMSDEEFAAAKQKLQGLGLPVTSAILFLPRELKVVGPDVDVAAQNAYLDKALPRLAELGLKMAVFGSGRSRTVPEGFDQKKAFDQVVEFGRRSAQKAKAHQLFIVVESLQSKETNMINTSADSLALVKAVNHPNFKMLVDHYHMSLMKEDPAVIVKAGKNHIVHVQMANPDGRAYPMSDEESDYATFFARLAQIGYRGGVSIEGRSDHFSHDAFKAIMFLRRATLPLSRGPKRGVQ